MIVNHTENFQKKSYSIVINTMLLFIRMFILMLINLYAVRLYTSALGDIDYGLYETVAGVVTMMTCLSSVIALATQRFFSYAEGKGDLHQMKQIFSVSLNLDLIFSFVVLILFETIGLWFVETQLVIPANRMDATLQVYQYAIFTFIFSLIQTPYLAAMLSNEDMGLYTIVSTIECLLKLLVAYLIGSFVIDNLEFYGLGLFIVSGLLCASYIFIGHSRYKECHYIKTQDKQLYKNILSFSGWTFLGIISNIGQVQGNKILLNICYGPITNAAFGISMQINHAFIALTNSIVLAIRPSMIRAYANNNIRKLMSLFNICNKMLFFLLVAIAIPIIFEMNEILNLWLGIISSEKLIFAQLVIIYVVILAMNYPITIIIHATGKVKTYHILVESITLLCLPISYVFFLIGLPSYFIFYSLISVSIIAHIVRLFCLKNCLNQFSIKQYIYSFVFPAIICTIIICLIAYICNLVILYTLLRFICIFILCPMLLFLLMYFIVVNKRERNVINNIILTFINKFIHKKEFA